MKLTEEQKAYIAKTIEDAWKGTPLQPNAKFAGGYLTPIVVSIMENWDVILDNLSGRKFDGKPIPGAVVAALTQYNTQHPASHVTVEELRWNSIQKCYFFERNGMLHGVELDGYIHT